ncbi:MAG: hypothetical protein RSG77_27050, partial [Hafnia sp.]
MKKSKPELMINNRTAKELAYISFKRGYSVIRDQGPCDLWGCPLNAGLAALYDQEQGHLMIWPPEHRYRWAG